MGDLIDRQAAIDALNKLKIYRPLDSDRYVISDCLNKIVNLPSAQPEIIYCKDCKHYVLRTLFGRSQGMCERLCKYDNSFSMLTEDDDFCSYAERRKQ